MGLCDTEPKSVGSTWPRKRIMFLFTDGGVKLGKKMANPELEKQEL